MATLHLRNVPADVDATLTADARALGVSKNRLAIEALRRGLALDQLTRARLVGEILDDRPEIDVDVADLIREDRPA